MSLQTKVLDLKMLNLVTCVIPDVVSVLLFREPYLDIVRLSDNARMMDFGSLSWQMSAKIFK